MRKTYFRIILTVVSIGIALLAGCDPSNPLGDRGLAAKQKAEKVVSHLKHGNSEALKDMFCDELKGNSNFDEKINEAMKFIDGEILSYKTVGGGGGSSETWERLSPRVTQIETERGKSYKIYLSIYTKNSDPDKLGIHQFQIHLLGDENEYGNKESIGEIVLYTE